jgi:hypothetical protein
MRLFYGRAKPVFARSNTAITRAPIGAPHKLAQAGTQPRKTPLIGQLMLLSELCQIHDGLSSSLTQAKKNTPFYAINSCKVPCITPLVWGLRFRLKGKTMRIRRIMRRYYLLRIGTSHPSTASVLFGIRFRHTAKQKQSAWSTS